MTLPSVTDIPSEVVGRRFRRMVLVACRQQLQSIDDWQDCLLVSSDWLAWRQAAEEGRPALHIEAGLRHQSDPRRDEDAYLYAQDWTCDQGDDATLFKGVSIGRQFSREIGQFLHFRRRLAEAVATVAREFGCTTIELIGLEADYHLLDRQTVRELVAEAAHAVNASFVDGLEAQRDYADQLPTARMVVTPPNGNGSLRGLWGVAVDVVSTVVGQCLARPKSVLVLPSLLMLRPMIAAMPDRAGVMPILLADRYPKRPRFAWSVLRAGLGLVRFPQCRLSRAERQDVGVIIKSLQRRLDGAGVGSPEHAVLRHVVEEIVGSGRFEAMATRIKQWSRLFSRFRFQRLLCTDSTNYESRIPLELIRLQGGEGVELVNGMFNTHQRHDSRTGRNGAAPLVGRFLAWGEQNEEWLHETRAPLACWRTGYPVLDPLREQKTVPGAGKVALVLANPPVPDDLSALRGDSYKYAVDVLRMLEQEGYQTSFKLHPGLERPEYYQDIFQRYGVRARIYKSEPIHPLMIAANIVVGPITSGAMAEALALGRPYYPFVPPLSSVTLGGMVDLPFFGDALELRQRLQQPMDWDRALDRLASCRSIPNSARAVWRALGVVSGKPQA